MRGKHAYLDTPILDAIVSCILFHTGWEVRLHTHILPYWMGGLTAYLYTLILAGRSDCILIYYHTGWEV